jgi:glycosyltransferase involved in cell wall biosynthesis
MRATAITLGNRNIAHVFQRGHRMLRMTLEHAVRAKPTILICIGHYLPGYKSGGPLRSIVNLVDHLQDDFDFRILTTDRDLGDSGTYTDIVPNTWNVVGPARVYYATPGTITLRGLARVIRDTPHDLLYINSFFSPRFSILPVLARRLGLIPHRPVVLAPRGEFSEGALCLKSWKKRAYLAFAKVFGLHSGITWQASSSYEAADIRREVGLTIGAIHVATDLPGRVSGEAPDVTDHETNAPLRIIFLSRISPKKNLHYALDVLCKVQVPISLNIYGPVEDEAYWRQCEAHIAQSPVHIDITYRGSVMPAQVAETMRNHDLFFLPTRGENYGHVIAEALSVGTPVLISDTTPWRDLQSRGLGCDLPLSDLNGFAAYIERMAQLNRDEKATLRVKVKNAVMAMQEESSGVHDNRSMFLAVLSARNDVVSLV